MRQAIIHLMIGARKMGKTTLTRKMLEKAPRVLYVMTIDHERYRDLRMLTHPEQLQALKGNFHVRLVCTNTKAVFEAINKYVWNTKIVYEDASKFIPAHPPQPIIDGVYDSRMKGNDLIFQFHVYMTIAPELFNNADYITIFSNRGKYDYDKVPDYLYPAIERVRRAPHQPDSYIQYHETIELD